MTVLRSLMVSLFDPMFRQHTINFKDDGRNYKKNISAARFKLSYFGDRICHITAAEFSYSGGQTHLAAEIFCN